METISLSLLVSSLLGWWLTEENGHLLSSPPLWQMKTNQSNCLHHRFRCRFFKHNLRVFLGVYLRENRRTQEESKSVRYSNNKNKCRKTKLTKTSCFLYVFRSKQRHNCGKIYRDWTENSPKKENNTSPGSVRTAMTLWGCVHKLS